MIPFYKFGLIIYKNWRIATLDPFTWSNWILCIVLMDFMFYVLHRLMHEINFFWVHHQVHHSSQIYTLVSSSRRPIFGFFIDAFALPICLLFHPRIVFFHWYVNGSVYQFWLHTEFCPKLPWPIEFIFNTPSQHRVHHGVNPYAIDKNYGGFLCIWDRLFGTFAEERDWDKEPLRYGLTTPIQASDPLSIQLSGPFELVKKVFKAKGMDKIRTIFYGPSWVPGAKHRLGNVHPNPTPPLKRYTLYQSIIDSELLLYLKMLTVVSAISIPYFAAIANPALEEAVTFLAMQSAGMILTFKQSIIPVYVEVCRVIATIIFLLNSQPGKYSKDAEKVYLYFYFASLFYLIWYCLKKRKSSSNMKNHLKYQSLHEE